MTTTDDICAATECSLRELQTLPLTYTAHVVKRRDGTDRIVHKPNPQLHAVQDKLLAFFEVLVQKRALKTHPAATAHIGSYENACRHAGAKHLLQVDIKDFYDYISALDVDEALVANGFTDEASALVTRLVTTQVDGFPRSLVQGAPTSALLADVVCERLDHELANTASTYTRYADDLTWSAARPRHLKAPDTIRETLQRYGFVLNEAKTRYSGPGDRFHITGFNVDSQPGHPAVRAPRDSWRRLRAIVGKLEREPDVDLYAVAQGLCAHLEQVDRERAKPYRRRIREVFRGL